MPLQIDRPDAPSSAAGGGTDDGGASEWEEWEGDDEEEEELRDDGYGNNAALTSAANGSGIGLTLDLPSANMDAPPEDEGPGFVDYGAKSKVTFASFNGMSTQIVKGTRNTTVFASVEAKEWPRKAIRRGVRTHVESRYSQATEAAAAASASGRTPTSPASGGGLQSSFKEPSRTQHSIGVGGDASVSGGGPSDGADVKVSLPPSATTTASGHPLVWTDADVSALDWRHFVIPPPEPPPPPPPLALRERLQEIYRLDTPGYEGAKAAAAAAAAAEEEDEFATGTRQGGGPQHSALQSKRHRMTLRERISGCPLHSQPRVTNETWVRMMLDRHELINKRTRKLVDKDAAAAKKKKKKKKKGGGAGGGDSDSDSGGDSSETGLEVEANDTSWQVVDPKYLTAERDQLKLQLSKALEDIQIVKDVESSKFQQAQKDLNKLQRALGLKERAEVEDYDAAVKEAVRKVRRQRHQAVLGAQAEERHAGELADARAAAADALARLPDTESEGTETETEEEEDGSEAEEARRRERLGAGPGGDVLWAERQLGFMGVHRDNALEQKAEVLEHIRTLREQASMQKEAKDAEAALNVLLAHQAQAEQEVGEALEVLERLGVAWYDVDLKRDVVAKEVDVLTKLDRLDDVLALKHAESAAEKHMEAQMQEALRALRPYNVTDRNLFAELEKVKQVGVDLKFQGMSERADDIHEAFCTLRRRRRALVAHANAVFALHGAPAGTILELKVRRAEAEAERLAKRGRRPEAKKIEGVVAVAQSHRTDAEAWAGRVLKGHGIDLAKQGAFLKAKTILAKMTDPAKRVDLKLAWDILERPAEGHEDKLLDSDQEFDRQEAKEQREATRKKKRSPSVSKEITRLIKSGEYTVEKLGGKNIFTDSGGNAVDIHEVARKKIDARRAERRGEDQVGRAGRRKGTSFADASGAGLGGGRGGSGGGAKSGEDVDYTRPLDVPFVEMVRQELGTLDEDMSFVGDEKERGAVARKRAKSRLKAAGVRNKRQIQVSDVASGEMVTKVVKGWSHEAMVREEVERMLRDSEWRKAVDARTGKEHFVNNETGEVQFGLEQAARDKLARDNVRLDDEEDEASTEGRSDDEESSYSGHDRHVHNPNVALRMRRGGGRSRSETLASLANEHAFSIENLTENPEASRVALRSKGQQRDSATRGRLIDFFRTNDPERIGKVYAMMEGWRGNEPAMFRYLDRYYEDKRKGLSPSPLRHRPHSPERGGGGAAGDAAATLSPQEKRTKAVQEIIERQGRVHGGLRQLLIKLYASADPGRLRGVPGEVRDQEGGDPHAYLRERVAQYGEEAALAAWAPTDASRLAEFESGEKVMSHALLRLAGGHAQGSDGQVAAHQLSPLFNDPSLLGGGAPGVQGGPARTVPARAILDTTVTGLDLTTAGAATAAAPSAQEGGGGSTDIRYVPRREPHQLPHQLHQPPPPPPPQAAGGAGRQYSQQQRVQQQQQQGGGGGGRPAGLVDAIGGRIAGMLGGGAGGRPQEEQRYQPQAYRDPATLHTAPSTATTAAAVPPPPLGVPQQWQPPQPKRPPGAVGGQPWQPTAAVAPPVQQRTEAARHHGQHPSAVQQLAARYDARYSDANGRWSPPRARLPPERQRSPSPPRQQRTSPPQLRQPSTAAAVPAAGVAGHGVRPAAVGYAAKPGSWAPPRGRVPAVGKRSGSPLQAAMRQDALRHGVVPGGGGVGTPLGRQRSVSPLQAAMAQDAMRRRR